MPRRPKPKLKKARTITELKGEFDSIWSTTAGDARFSAQANLFIAEQLVAIRKLLEGQAAAVKPKRRRQSSTWQRFFAAGMKAGKSPALIGKEWREAKERAA